MTRSPAMTDAFLHTIDRMAGRMHEGETPTALHSVSILKVTTPGELAPELQKPIVSLILQGEKRLTIGGDVLHYRAGDTYAAAIDLPTRIEILGCSLSRRYMAVALRPDPALIADLARRSETGTPASSARAFAVHSADTDLLDAYRRLMQLLDRPDDLDVMGPLIEREILFRLWQGPQRPVLRKIAENSERNSGIEPAIALIRRGYTAPLLAADLAKASGMSIATFYRRFKAETGMSPLQYRTRLRLYEARRRLLAAPTHVALLAFDIGYESASQFSREYVREFGVPPARDAARLHATMAAG